jgi:hypothetical protein
LQAEREAASHAETTPAKRPIGFVHHDEKTPTPKASQSVKAVKAAKAAKVKK